MALILYRVMRQRLKRAGHEASPEMALAVLDRIQRQAITISPRPTPRCSCSGANS